MSNTVSLASSTSYTMWASNKAQEVAHDGKISTGELKQIAKEFGTSEKLPDAGVLMKAGFNSEEANNIVKALKVTGWATLGVTFKPSALSQLADAAKVVAKVAINTTVSVATGGLVTNGAAQIHAQAKQFVAAAGVVKEKVGEVYTQVKTKVVATVGDVKVKAAQFRDGAVNTVVKIAKAKAAFDEGVATFGKGVVHGAVHAAEHLAHSTVAFVKSHPVIATGILLTAAVVITVATGGLGGVAVAGAASSLLSGIGTAGMIAGSVVVAGKAVQTVGELAKGNIEKAGEKFGEGLFEAAVTFAPGAAIKGLKSIHHTAHAAVEGANLAAKAAQGSEGAVQLESTVLKLASKASLIHKTEKAAHVTHQVFESQTIIPATGAGALDMIADAFVTGAVALGLRKEDKAETHAPAHH
ncbi:MAG: hypothetical protein H7338_17540 [Candidatus Sericytochromatia bacterium]|nr:hypothetical protein [Candidatus Sericytochromatia bacterium]